MSMLQELEQIRKEIGKETYNAIQDFLGCNPQYLITDVYYKESVWKEFEIWRAMQVVEKLMAKQTTMYYLQTEECQKALRTLLDVVKPHTPQAKNTDVEISGIIFRHGEDDYGLWEGFHLSQEDENAIQTILAKYDTDGCSVRGTRKEIAREMEE